MVYNDGGSTKDNILTFILYLIEISEIVGEKLQDQERLAELLAGDEPEDGPQLELEQSRPPLEHQSQGES